jgi:hypothetical protein
MLGVARPARLARTASWWATLRTLPPHTDDIGVMLLAEHARNQFHPAT